MSEIHTHLDSVRSVDCDTGIQPSVPSGHFVQFYQDEVFLISCVTRFATRAIRAREALVVIATPSHRSQLDAELERAGMDPAALQAAGQYVALDAEQTLAKFMIGGLPDFALFNATIGPLLSQAERAWPRVRAFGEMVAVLCAQGNRAAACELEKQWNALAAVHEFDLFCAYPLREFQDEGSDASYWEICTTHSRVLPSEKLAEDVASSDAARTIALLQQRTQRLEREVELRKIAQRELSDFMDNAIVGLHKVDRTGKILWANAAELEMLGYGSDEYVGRSVLDFHADREVAEELLDRLRAGEQLVEFAARLRCRDGSIRHARISSNGYFENGQFVYSRCITRDVTDSVNLDAERALLATIVESSQDAIVTKTLDGVITSWNPAAERMLGYESSEAVGKHISLIIPQERSSEEQEIVSKLRRGERTEHYETVRLAKGGREVEISLTISPIRDGQGRVIGASKIARDIGARKAADRALRESEHRFSSFMRCLPGLAWIKDADGRYVFANEAVEKPFGVACEDLLGKTDRDLFDEDTAAQIAESDRSALESERGIKVVEKLDQDDGLHHYVISKFPISGPHVAGHVGGVAIDITERIRAEHALTESDRRKDEFLATLAHELRNPLAPLQNSLRFLRMSKAGSAETRPVYEIMERQVVHMVRLVDDLLELSRISRGKIELRRERVALGVLVELALDTSRPMIERGSHVVDIELPPDPIMLFGDPVRLSQVFANLFNNASKFATQPGIIRFHAERRGDVVVASVRDSGIGIPAGMLSRVFEMFTQVENPLRENQDGLGIGLSLVRTLVEMHGGQVEARSAGLGQGSEFLVTLPLATGSEPGNGGLEDVPAARTSAACRILAVDDNRDSADSLGMMLRCLGAEVSLAYDGPSAIEKIKLARPSVVLMDIGMPRMDGYEVARRIRQDPQNDSVLLVALTGWGQEQDRRRSREAGFDHHLVKPVELDALQALLASRSRSH